VFLEAPHRVEDMLKDVLEILGDRVLTIAREMTKIFEEIKRGTVASALRDISAEPPRGEYTIVIEGSQGQAGTRFDDQKLARILELVLEKRPMGMKEIALRVSEITDIPFRKIYRECLALGKPAGGKYGNGNRKESDSQE
jgi:16S rRNA (cytidine1402-2'-O)-methyltransferase